jgi:hypothetical protein
VADRGVFDRGLELRLHLCGSCVTDSTSGTTQHVIILPTHMVDVMFR